MPVAPPGWRGYSEQRGTEKVDPAATPLKVCKRCGQVGYFYTFDEAPFCYDQLVSGGYVNRNPAMR